MASSDFSEQQVTSTQDMVNSLLGLRLSNTEVKILLSGETLPFEELTKNRSLSEIGTALIRADALSRLEQENPPLERKCEDGCSWISFHGTGKCVCLFRLPTLELSIH